jgi:methylmalonyl-CoA mutase
MRGSGGAGATLGEITRAIRIHDRPCAPIKPVASPAPPCRLKTARRHGSHGTRQPAREFSFATWDARLQGARRFSRGFFATGGYEVISPEGFQDARGAAGRLPNRARIAVICSTDENYPALVPPLFKAFARRNRDAIIVLAGFPQEQVEAHKKGRRG